MNAKEFSLALGNVRDGYVAEAAVYQSARRQHKKQNWLKIGIAAAGFCLAAGGVGVFCYKLEHPYPVKNMVSDNLGSGEIIKGCWQVPYWEEMQIYEQYSQLTVDGRNYFAHKSKVPAERLGGELGSIVAKGWDVYADLAGEEGERYLDADVYEIAGISRECAVAVRYEGTDTYYAAVNSSYRPETLGQFIEDLDLRNTLIFNCAYYQYRKPISKEYADICFEKLADEKVWEMLLANPEAVNEYHDLSEKPERILGISVDVPLLGYENISLSIRENGYIITNILDTGKQFYIGEEHTQAFVDYVLKECEGYECVWSAAE